MPAALAMTGQGELHAPDAGLAENADRFRLAPDEPDCPRPKSVHGGRNVLEFVPVKVVIPERALQQALDLSELGAVGKIGNRTAHGKIVDDDVLLIEGSLGHAAQLDQLVITEVLNSDPDNAPQHDQNQHHRPAAGQQQEEAEKTEGGADGVEDERRLAGREAALQQLVMDVLAVAFK